MTEEEKKDFINREAKRLTAYFPDMPNGMIDAIMEWNVDRDINFVTDTQIDWVGELAHKQVHVNFDNLLSENTELAYGTLIAIIGRDLAGAVCKNDILEQMFERYVYNIQNFCFGNRKTADEVCPLK